MKLVVVSVCLVHYSCCSGCWGPPLKGKMELLMQTERIGQLDTVIDFSLEEMFKEFVCWAETNELREPSVQSIYYLLIGCLTVLKSCLHSSTSCVSILQQKPKTIFSLSRSINSKKKEKKKKEKKKRKTHHAGLVTLRFQISSIFPENLRRGSDVMMSVMQKDNQVVWFIPGGKRWYTSVEVLCCSRSGNFLKWETTALRKTKEIVVFEATGLSPVGKAWWTRLVIVASQYDPIAFRIRFVSYSDMQDSYLHAPWCTWGGLWVQGRFGKPSRCLVSLRCVTAQSLGIFPWCTRIQVYRTKPNSLV